MKWLYSIYSLSKCKRKGHKRNLKKLAEKVLYCYALWKSRTYHYSQDVCGDYDQNLSWNSVFFACGT